MSDLFDVAYKVGREMPYSHRGRRENSKREQPNVPSMEARQRTPGSSRQDVLTAIPAINSPMRLAPAHARIVALGIP